MGLAWKTNLARCDWLTVVAVAWADRHAEVGALIFDSSVPSAGVLENSERDDGGRGNSSLHMGGVGVVNDTNDRRLVHTESQRDTDIRESMNL